VLDDVRAVTPKRRGWRPYRTEYDASRFSRGSARTARWRE